MTTKAKGTSVRQKITDLGKKIGVETRNIETVFMIERVKRQAESDLNDGVWLRYESQIDLATQGEYGGIRHSYRAGIGEVLKNLSIQK